VGLISLDIKDGSQQWNYSPSPNLFYGVPASTQSAVYIRSSYGVLHAISSDTGELLWDIKIGNHAHGGSHNVSITQNKIFISSTDNSLYIIKQGD